MEGPRDTHLLDGGRRTSKLFMQDEWVPDLHYHLIGKAVPDEVLFREEADYRRFLRKCLRDRLRDVMEFHSYCLIPNHWHGGVRTRTPGDVKARLRKTKKPTATDLAYLAGEVSYAVLLAQRLQAAVNSHAQYYNKKYGREGQLFVKPTLHGLTNKGPLPGAQYSRRMNAYIGLNYAKHSMGRPEAVYHWSSLNRSLYQIIELDIDKYYGSQSAYKAYHIAYMRKHGARFYNFDEGDFFTNLEPRRYLEEERRWILEDWRRAEGE